MAKTYALPWLQKFDPLRSTSQPENEMTVAGSTSIEKCLFEQDEEHVFKGHLIKKMMEFPQCVPS